MISSARCSVSILLCLGLSPLGRGQVVTTVAGSVSVFRGDGQAAVAASIGPIEGVAVDSAGNVFATDTGNHLVVKIAPNGTLTVVAGNGLAGFSGDGGPATSASLTLITSLGYKAAGVAVDKAGNLYVADGNNRRVRKITTDGTITTVAGGGPQACTIATGVTENCDGIPATSASLPSVAGVAVDDAGNIYVVDPLDKRVRRINTSGIITTVAGGGPFCIPPQQPCGGDGGPAIGASLFDPPDVAVDPPGNLYIVERDTRVRKVDSQGIITTVSRALTISPFGAQASGIAVDTAGNLYLATSDQRIVKVTTAGTASPIAGNGTLGFSGDGGPALTASMNRPSGVAVDGLGNVYVADRENFRVRKVSAAGIISTIAGGGNFKFAGDGGPATSASLYAPFGLALDRAGNLLICDTKNHRIRRVNPAGVISTIAGSGAPGPPSGDGGPATGAILRLPEAVAVDAAGSIYIGDTWNFRIRKVSPAGTITTVAGTGTSIPAGLVTGLALDQAGLLYFVNGHQVLRLNSGGGYSVVAGTGDAGFSGDGGPAINARLSQPIRVTLDAVGNLYIADYQNARIRKVDRNGIITTVAGNGRIGFSGDGGVATNASLSFPRGLAVDTAGNMYIGDAGNYRIRKVGTDGIITTIAGIGGFGFSGDGGPATSAALTVPADIATDAAGNIYFADPGPDRVRVILAAPPAFQATPASLTFSGRSGGATPPSQAINLTNSTPGLPFLVSSDAPWLQATPSGGTMPVTLQVSADPARLPPGMAQGTVTITAPAANPPMQTVTVTFNVDAARSPLLGIDGEGLSFSFRRGAGSSTSQITVLNRGDGTLDFTAAARTSAGSAWLSVTPANGTVTATSTAPLNVTVNPAGLAPGTYTGSISVSGSSGSGAINVPVTITISGALQTILLSQTGLTFTTVAGSGTAPPQGFGVLNTGQGSMNWTASASTISGGSNWLSISPASGATDAASLTVPLVNVAVNPAGLAPGDYYGQVQITAPADNSPQFVSVVLNVLPPGSNPGPVVRPTGLIFAGFAGATNPGSQTAAVSNITASPINFASSRLTYDGQDWFVHAPSNAAVQPGETVQLVVQPDISNLGPGIRRGVLTLLFQDGTVRTVNILLVLISGSPASAKSHAADAACTPSRLLPLFTSLGGDFSVPAAWPTPVEVRVVDDCGNPMTTGSVLVTFSNGDPPVLLVSLKSGRWTGTWQPRGSRPAVTVTATARLAAPSLEGTTQLTGGLQANANPPVLNAGGVVSAASFTSQAPLSPGSMISIFGSQLATGQTSAGQLPLDTQLSGTLVAIGGRPLPLLYASDAQINAMIPYDIAVNTQQQIVVRRGSSYTVPATVTLAAATPAVFTKDKTGKGQGVVLDAQNRFVEPGNAAKAGDGIVIFCEGLGTVDPSIAAGNAAPLSPLARTVNPVSLTIGGVAAQVFFAGLTPNFAGLFQVNALVPDGIAAGDAVPVVLTAAGVSSVPVTMAIR